jgi:hypothetical protein
VKTVILGAVPTVDGRPSAVALRETVVEGTGSTVEDRPAGGDVL